MPDVTPRASSGHAPAPNIALSLPIPSLSLPESVRLAEEANALGYRDCWIGEVGGPDAVTLSAAVLARTALRVGTAVVPIYDRTPMVLAMTAASLADLSEGRFVLGLGTSSETIVSRWNGVPFDRPLTRMRETVQVLRALLDGEKVTFDGETVRLADYRVTMPLRHRPKIYMAALGPRMLRLAGEVADGVIINMLGAEHVPKVLAEVAEGARSAGRDPSELEVVARIQVALDQPDEVAFAMVRMAFAAYVATGVYNRFFRWLGFEEEADGVAAGWAARDRQATSAAISDRLARAIVVNGDAETCRRHLQAHADGGVDSVAVSPLSPAPDDAWRTMRALAPRG